MSDVTNTSTLIIAYRHATYWVLAPSPTGTPELVAPAPLIYRVTYLTDAEAAQPEPWNAVGAMTDPFSYIGIRIPSPDGVPAQSLILFKFGAKGPISYVADGRSFQSIEASTYQAASPLHRMIWDTEIHQGRLGYFLIGSERSMGLWKVVRAEVDYINRSIFTIVPVKLANECPPEPSMGCHGSRDKVPAPVQASGAGRPHRRLACVLVAGWDKCRILFVVKVERP